VEFAEIFSARSWTPIRGCPGRYGLADGAVLESPGALVPDAAAREFRVTSARDVVIVIPFADGGGLISYKRGDGTYVHTLNDDDGFRRKLTQLHIQLG
jgi:hypothetical protein